MDVGANGKKYLPAYTGVLLHSEIMTEEQLLNDGIDGNGITIKGTNGRTQPADLTGNMLISSDKDYQEHISTYDKDGNINLAFNHWKNDSGGEYYAFLSFYENNTQDNKNNYRHTAYLQLPKGSKEIIKFADI